VKLAVVTSNPHKAREVAAFFAGALEVEHVQLECPEFRDVDVGEIARGKAQFAWDNLERPLIVDDTAFSVKALKGFPGPYAAYVLDTLGYQGILRLLEGAEDREAYFETAIAYAARPGAGRDSATTPSSRWRGRPSPRSPSGRRAGSPTGQGRFPPSGCGGGRNEGNNLPSDSPLNTVFSLRKGPPGMICLTDPA
jgi:non-canonical purine NTP pyrophosphatase (RdgB/HAM1 family)